MLTFAYATIGFYMGIVIGSPLVIALYALIGLGFDASIIGGYILNRHGDQAHA